MKILIDAHVVGEQETGNETYIVNLLRGLAHINHGDEIVVAATHPEAVKPLMAGAKNWTVVSVSANPVQRLLRDLPSLATRLKADLLFVTYTGPVSVSCPMAAIVHDVSFKRHPEWFSPRDRLVLNVGVGLTVRRSAAVLTLSEFSKREIAETCSVPAERIHVTRLAAAQDFGLEGVDDEGVRARYGLRRPYLLAVGNLQPRKNLLRLIEAFARLKDRPGFGHDLVLAGKAHWQGSAVASAIERLALSSRVKLIGYVTAKELPAIYRGASLFIYPSLYEGFGLPVLEAMACGTPVLTSNVSAIPEVAGRAARLVNPESVDELAAGMEEMCAGPDQRAMWQQRGLAQSRLFTWERTASETLDIFRRVASAAPAK